MNETAGKNWLHLDLKGAIPSFDKMLRHLVFFRECGFNGIIFEYEDRIPWKSWPGTWRGGYTAEEVNGLLKKCSELNLETVPLVQTLGHLEWLLKHPEYEKFSENHSSSDICPLNPEIMPLLKRWLLEVMELHRESRFVHIGADETWFLGTCSECSRHDKMELYCRHISELCRFVLEHGKRPIIWADVFQRENRMELAKEIPEGTVFADWQYTGVPPYPGTQILLDSGHEVMGSSGTMIGWWEHCLQVMSEPQGRIDNVTGWNRWCGERSMGVIHTTWTRGASLWNMYGTWFGALPAFIAAGNGEKWEKHPWNAFIRELSGVMKLNQIHELKEIENRIMELPVANEMEKQARRWIFLAVRYQRYQQELQIHRSTRRTITEVEKYVGHDESLFRKNCVDPFKALLPELDRWEADARAFWKENTLSNEDEFMATHIDLIRKDVLSCLNS